MPRRSTLIDPSSVSNWRLAVLVFGSMLVPTVAAIFIVPGIEEGSQFETVRSALQQSLIPEAGGALIVGFVIYRARWWSRVRDEGFRTERWVRVVPAIMAGVSLLAIDVGNLVGTDATMLVVFLVSMVCVGVYEELLFRGVVLTTMRARHAEFKAAVLTSVLFGAWHLCNAPAIGGAALVQAIWATAAGYLLYLCKRVGGSIWLPIGVHALWDLATFSSQVGVDDALLTDDPRVLMPFVPLILAVVVYRKRRSIPAEPEVIDDEREPLQA